MGTFFHFGLDQPVCAGPQLKQPGLATHTWEGEGMMQPSPPYVTLSVGITISGWL